MRGKIAVVGAGVGGLSCAARLAHDGYDVQVFEKLDKCGGRNQLFEDKGFKFDMGPSFVLMPDFFEEVFLYCGENLKDYLNLKVLDVNYKIFYPDGDSFTVFKDSSRTKEELERLEKGSSKNFDRFIKETSRIYRLVKPLLYKCFTPASLVNLSYWPLLLQLRTFESYWSLAGKFFKTDKLRYAFTFEAMFMGVSPFQAPAFYSIISYTDHVQKIAHPMGGMYKIPLALERMAKKFGATFGLAHNLTQSAFFRPPNFDSENKNIYFVGASTQPGGGLPVVIAGSRIVADSINKS